MQPDSDLVALVDDLLRTDPRLLAAAALIGKVAVVVTEPKTERVRKSTPKRPPPRTVGTPEAPICEPEPEAPKPTAAPWLKVARARAVSDAIRAAIGGQWLAVVTVDGGSWGRLCAEDQRRALALALRPLRHEEREDGSDKVAREAPPIQCWPDTTNDLSHLMAALGPDGAEGAAAVCAAEALTNEQRTDRTTLKPGWVGWACSVIRDMRTTWANQIGPDPSEWEQEFPRLAARVREALGEDDAAESLADTAEIVACGPHGDVLFWYEEDGEVRSYEIGWGHASRDRFSDAGWSAHGFGLYQSGDLHDGYSSVREILRAFRRGVYLSLNDYRAGRGVTIEAVVDAARKRADLPPVAESTGEWLDGEDESADAED